MMHRIGLCLIAVLSTFSIGYTQELDNTYLEIPTRNRGLQVTYEGGANRILIPDNLFDCYCSRGLNGVLGYKVNPRISIGVGLGLGIDEVLQSIGAKTIYLDHFSSEFDRTVETEYSGTLFLGKLFVRGQYRFLEARFTPFVGCDIGVNYVYGGLEDICRRACDSWDIQTRFRANEYYQLLGEPSKLGSYLTPSVGLSLRTANNSYIELKVGYIISSGLLKRTKSIAYEGCKVLHNPIKMSAPLFSLSYTHTLGIWSDLDESLYEATRAKKRAKRAQRFETALVVTGAVLGAAATVAGAVNAVQNNNSDIQTNDNKNKEIAKKHKEEAKKNRVPDLLNDQGEDKNYNNWISQLIDMSAYPEKYEGRFTENRTYIQKQMREIRERVNNRRGKTVIRKSPWEDWDGDLNSHP